MQETIFLDFKHSTTCYKKSNQSCFKIQRNSAKSPVFLAQFILLGPSGYYTAPLEVLIKVVRNVTREFEKLTNTSPSRKRRSPALSEEESTHQPKGKWFHLNHENNSNLVRYAENDQFLTISISKDNPAEIDFWLNQLKYFAHSNPDQYQSVPTVDSVFH